MCKKLIHLGCFDQPQDGWENYDITPHLFIARIPFLPYVLFKLKLINSLRYEQHKKRVFNKVKYMNLNKKLKFDDNTVDAYYSSHVFEHLYLKNVRNLLKEIYRTLKPGGILRTALPDLDKILSLYDEKNPNKVLDYLFENNDKSNYKNYHKWMYTKYSFLNELEKAGFDKNKINISDYNISSYDIFKDMDNRQYISFYIEAKK